jgi:hypothetical protein
MLVLASPLVYYFNSYFFVLLFLFFNVVIYTLRLIIGTLSKKLKRRLIIGYTKEEYPVNNKITRPNKTQYPSYKGKKVYGLDGTNLNTKGKKKEKSLTTTKTDIPVVCCCF